RRRRSGRAAGRGRTRPGPAHRTRRRPVRAARPQAGQGWLWRSAFASSPVNLPERRPEGSGRLGRKHRPAGKVPPGPPGPVRGILSAMSDPATDERMMALALRLAAGAADHGDVPIGAVVARGAEVLGQAGNERELRGDPTAHAEVLALREAAKRLGGWRLLETTLYVTLEPCPMCAGAITLARVPRLVYGTADPKGGAVGSVIDLFAEPVVNHRPTVEAGRMADDAAARPERFVSGPRAS